MVDPRDELLPYQRAAVYCPARFTWNCWARQTGKSFAFSLRRVLRALERRRDQIIVSAGQRQSREVMHKVRMHCHALEAATTLLSGVDAAKLKLGQLEATLPGGARIIALPANPATARGYSGDVFLDEFALQRDDREIWAALFPSLLRGGGELDIASTPKGRRNLFYRLASNPSFTHSTVTLAEAIAAGLVVDADAMREANDDELYWRQEFGCEFIDEATSFMPLDLIRQCQDASLRCAVDWPRLERREADVYVGIDVGRKRDATVAWVWERVTAAQRLHIRTPSASERAEHEKGPSVGATQRQSDEGRSTAQQSRPGKEPIARAIGLDNAEFITRGVLVPGNIPFAAQEDAISELIAMPAIRRCCIDSTGLGMQMAERLAAQFGKHRVEDITFTAPVKSEMAGFLRVLAERGQLRIPIDDAIVNDWHAIARLTSLGGHVRYDADRSSGGHGDRFWAAALGLHAGRHGGGRVSWETGGPMRFSRGGVW